MKYDLNKKMTVGACRTLLSLQRALLSLLTEKPFEDIAVGDICVKAMVPRATFYNYFVDKSDLLSYCFASVRTKLESEIETASDCHRRMDILLENCFDFLDGNIGIVEDILKYNHRDMYLINQIRYYLISGMSEAFKEARDAHRFKIPSEMAADLYSRAIMIILEWKYLDKKECSKGQAKIFLKQMIGGIEEEGER